MKKTLVLTATGDSLFTADMPKEYDADLKEISAKIAEGEVRMTNLETNISNYGKCASAYSGGTWINLLPEDFDYLTKYGFNYYGTANNHTMDFSYHGLLSTLDELDKRGLAHSGSGKDLNSAGAPAIIEVNGKKIGIIAFTSDYENASKAGLATPAIAARPGVNYLGSVEYLQVDAEDVEAMKKIAKKCHINDYFEHEVATGYELPTPEGLYKFGNALFCYDGSKPTSACNKADKERIVESVRKAKEVCDYVIVFSHCHAIKEGDEESAPDFLIEIDKACIDAGASAVIGSGTHQIRPIEIYKGKPLIYSLGDFTYQGMRVKQLPADFLLKYGCDLNATAWEALMARSKNNTIGLQTMEECFLTLLPKMEFEGEEMVKMEMYPVSLGFNREGDMNGLPYIAKGEEAKKIFDIVNRLSIPFGTKMSFDGEKITVDLK